jgi:hypothetical protein
MSFHPSVDGGIVLDSAVEPQEFRCGSCLQFLLSHSVFTQHRHISSSKNPGRGQSFFDEVVSLPTNAAGFINSTSGFSAIGELRCRTGMKGKLDNVHTKRTWYVMRLTES